MNKNEALAAEFQAIPNLEAQAKTAINEIRAFLTLLLLDGTAKSTLKLVQETGQQLSNLKGTIPSSNSKAPQIEPCLLS